MDLSTIKAFLTPNTPDQPFALRRLAVTWGVMVKGIALLINPLVSLVRDLATAGTLTALVGVDEANQIIEIANGLGGMITMINGTEFTPIAAVVAPPTPEPTPAPETPAPTPEPPAPSPEPEPTVAPTPEPSSPPSQAASTDKPTSKSKRNANA